MGDTAGFDAGFSAMFTFAGIFIAVVAILIIVSIVRNVVKARQLGHDPMTMQTELMARAIDSTALAPERTLEQRLAELDDLRARGVISDAEHAKARADALAQP